MEHMRCHLILFFWCQELQATFAATTLPEEKALGSQLIQRLLPAWLLDHSRHQRDSQKGQGLPTAAWQEQSVPCPAGCLSQQVLVSGSGRGQ